MSEETEQNAFFKHVDEMAKIDHRYENIYAIPNGEKRSKRTGGRLKHNGVKPGVLDINVDYPSKGYHGLRIEMKDTDGKLSDDQKEWIERFKKACYATAVCYSAEEAKNITFEYFGMI